jgi:hypothetical protein
MGGAGLDAASVEARLPAGWRVEETETGVRGYAGSQSEGGVDAHGLDESFQIRREGDLWAASWSGTDATTGRRGGADSRVTGVKERCVNWVVRQARRNNRHSDIT